ncbi:hypothetical protein [Vacuolonema iberomarrocanum]|uniref:hypothetical protein n=1 Tax=Vacuolonema iberomarrocanum TaxID=3454632 RepID=UPI001A0C8A80|nr:hypothetical protein [filamentous cyanobacterium LEGE 07170]
MNTKFRYLLPCLVVSLLVGFPVPFSAQAQPGQVCESDGDFEPPSDITRVVELSQFDISVTIPENYRIMERQDGSVQILHPDTFEWIQCVQNGGIGASGYYQETLQSIAPVATMTLREQIASMLYDPDAIAITAYEQNGLDGYIAYNQGDYSALFLGTIPGSDQLLRVLVACDCEINLESLTELLAEIRPLQ